MVVWTWCVVWAQWLWQKAIQQHCWRCEDCSWELWREMLGRHGGWAVWRHWGEAAMVWRWGIVTLLDKACWTWRCQAGEEEDEKADTLLSHHPLLYFRCIYYIILICICKITFSKDWQNSWCWLQEESKIAADLCCSTCLSCYYKQT